MLTCYGEVKTSFKKESNHISNTNDSKCRQPTDVSPALFILASVTSFGEMSSYVSYLLAGKLFMT